MCHKTFKRDTNKGRVSKHEFVEYPILKIQNSQVHGSVTKQNENEKFLL
jgi:hypothetical protein